MAPHQETLAAHAVIGCAQRFLADMDGVLPDDYHASTTAIIWRALEMRLGGMAGVDRLISARNEE
jgi:hypothetical protein